MNSPARQGHFVSTGHLPSPEQVKALVGEAHTKFKSNTDGKNSQVYPALARVPSNLFGICVVGTSGNVYPAAGFVAAARDAGAHTVELNLEPSEGASLFFETHYGPATQIVPVYIDKLLTAQS